MNRTECTLTDAAKKIERDFLLIGLPVTFENFLTSEEYETLKSALKGFLPDNCEENWNVINRIYQKVDKLAAEAPALKLHATSELIRKESLNSKPKFIGFESYTLDETIQKVNEFVSSDKCKYFISAEFKVTKGAGVNLYVGIVRYRAPAQDEDKTEHISNDVKEFASEVRKTIEDTYQSFGGSERFDFCDHGLALIESVQNKLDEVLK